MYCPGGFSTYCHSGLDPESIPSSHLWILIVIRMTSDDLDAFIVDPLIVEWQDNSLFVTNIISMPGPFVYA
jgi:hypothetical protein